MAKYRPIYVSFWDDQNIIENFTPEDKFFYLYLLTNSRTTQIGIYRLPKKIISFEMGYSYESVRSLLDRFTQYHKLIKYNDNTGEIAIKNWGKYNLTNSGKPILDLIKSELIQVEDISFLEFVSNGINNETIKSLFSSYITAKTARENINSPEPKNENLDIPYGDEAYNDTPNEALTPSGQNIDIDIDINKKENINNICASEDQNSAANCNTESLSDDKSSDTDKSNVPYKEIIELFNNTCKSLPKVKARTKQRDKMIKSLWLRCRCNLLNIEQYFKKVEISDFLTGRNSVWMNCNFDWLLKESNFIKVQEGNYNNKNSPSNNASTPKGKGTFNSFDQRDYDYGSLEQNLLEASMRRSFYE